MATHAMARRTPSDDPRRLRELLARTSALASAHALPSVVVGLAAPEGDLLFPEFVDFVESELRMEDAIFRMTRERVMLFLADVDRQHAEGVVERLCRGFCERVSAIDGLRLATGYFEVRPGSIELAAKHVLPAVFAGRPLSH